MNLNLSYALSLDITAKSGTTPSALVEENVSFLEQALAFNMVNAKLLKYNLNISTGGNQSINLTNSGLVYVRALLVKSTTKITLNLDGATSTGKLIFTDYGEVSPLPTRTTPLLITLTNPVPTSTSSSTSTNTPAPSSLTLVIAGY